MFVLYSLSLLPLKLTPLIEDTSMITVPSCGVEFQEILSGLEERLNHWKYTVMHFCGFSQHSLISSTWGVSSTADSIPYFMMQYIGVTN